MSLLPFLVVAFVAGSLSLLTRRLIAPSAAIGVAGLLLALVAASTIRADEPVRVADAALAGTEFTRLFLVLGCAAGLLLLVVGAATAWPRSLPGATLCGLGAAGLALGVTDPSAAVAAATAGAVAGVLVALPGSGLERGLPVAARELRALVVAGVLALLAVAAAAIPLLVASNRTDAPDAPVLGLAYLAFATATAIRLGAIPFHLRAARVADVAPEVALPLVMAWGPAAFAIVALGWVDASVATFGEPLPAERALIVLVAAASLLLATGAALIHDDLEHVVAYSIVADAGVALLGLAALDPAAWAPMRTWLLALVAGKTALAAWAGAVRGTYGSGRVSELAGWARRAPLLALALAAIGIAAVGWPDMAAFSARAALIDLAVDGPLAVLLLVGGLASAAIYVRLLVVGTRRPGTTVRGAPAARPAWPAAMGRTGRPLADATAAWTLNRVPAAGAAALVLALVAVAVAGGGLGASEAAAALPPGGAPETGAP